MTVDLYRIASVKIIDVSVSTDEMIEYAARNCWGSEEKLGLKKEFLKGIMAKGHWSVFEFGRCNYELEFSRVASHQQVRHRLASYAQRSQRVVEPEDEGFTVPLSIINHPDPKYLEMFEKRWFDCLETYHTLIDAGIVKGDARYIIPNCCNTKIVIGTNYRHLFDIFQQRIESRAQWEIKSAYIILFNLLHSLSSSKLVLDAFLETNLFKEVPNKVTNKPTMQSYKFKDILKEETQKLVDKNVKFKYVINDVDLKGSAYVLKK